MGITALLMVVISFFITDKLEHTLMMRQTSNNIIGGDLDSGKIQERLKEVNEVIATKVEEAIVKVDDNLSLISNEKIMAVNEFGEQILEKINHNHSEVVFLYNMLNEKEKELKELIVQVNQGKNMVKEDEKRTLSEREEKGREDNTVTMEEISALGEAEENKNQMILDLHKQGKTILDISKQLEIGQGEVKLVIDLFQGVKP